MTNSLDQKDATQKTYPCPTCKKPTTWQDNAFKPFCKERCKIIDLGAWANEDYKIGSSDSDVFSSDMEGHY